MLILITYDVDTTNPAGAKRLRRVAKACVNFGQRVQNSVFECELTEANLCILMHTLAEIIDTTKDSIRFYKIKNPDRITVLGKQTAFSFANPMII